MLSNESQEKTLKLPRSSGIKFPRVRHSQGPGFGESGESPSEAYHAEIIFNEASRRESGVDNLILTRQLISCQLLRNYYIHC
nr:hypothetical protein [uncultured archaeon]